MTAWDVDLVMATALAPALEARALPAPDTTRPPPPPAAAAETAEETATKTTGAGAAGDKEEADTEGASTHTACSQTGRK
jgi:hypothetical protein